MILFQADNQLIKYWFNTFRLKIMKIIKLIKNFFNVIQILWHILPVQQRVQFLRPTDNNIHDMVRQFADSVAMDRLL